MLEQLSETLSSINDSLKRLVQIAETQNTATGELGAPKAEFTIKGTRTRAKVEKVEPAAPEVVPATEHAPVFTLAVGDPIGTRYFIIDKHNSVARVLPGEHTPSISGMVQVGGDAYLHAKAEQAKKSLTAQPQAVVEPTVAPAESTVTTTSTTSAAAAGVSTASSSEGNVSFHQVADALMKLAQGSRDGTGLTAVKAFLGKHLPDESKPRVPMLEFLKKNDELFAEVQSLLNPVATGAAADDIFG